VARRLEALSTYLVCLLAFACRSEGSRVCTAAGCLPGVTLEFSEPLTTPGAYHVKVYADGRAAECRLSVPATTSDSCTGALSVAPFAKNPMTRLPLSDFAGISVTGRYGSIALSVRREGRLLVQGSAIPRYVGHEINGPGCGTCPGAKLVFASVAR
jgi:hypothetical protein